MEFRLVSRTRDGKEIELGNISEVTHIGNRLSEDSKDSAGLVNIRTTKNLSINCFINPSLPLAMVFEYCRYKTWNNEILQQLTIICDPRCAECLTWVPRGHRMASFFTVAFVLKDLIEHLDSYLSEYQYLNPLF
jgi:hypothetical protein